MKDIQSLDSCCIGILDFFTCRLTKECICHTHNNIIFIVECDGLRWVCFAQDTLIVDPMTTPGHRTDDEEQQNMTRVFM